MYERRRRTGVAITLLSVAALVAAGCSSGDSDEDGGSGSGDTIVIGSSGSLSNPAYSEPELQSGLEAAISSINEAGGVKGKQLKLEFCDSAYDVNKELSCARELIAKKVAAVVHPSILADGSGAEYKLYAEASIPVFGGQGASPAELQSDIAYPLGSGLPGWAYGAAAAVKNAGAKKVSVLVVDTPPAKFSGQLVVDALEKLDVESAGMVTGDAKADPTFATAVAKATADGVDGVVFTPAPVDIPNIVKALKQSGFKGATASIAPMFASAILDAVGPDGNGTLISSQNEFTTDTSNPGVTEFLDDMKQYQPDSEIADRTLSGWAAAQLFAKIAATSDSETIDAKSFKAALDNLSTPIDIGVVAPYAVKGRTSPLPDYPRILNPTVTIGTVTGGEIVTDGGGFINPFEIN